MTLRCLDALRASDWPPGRLAITLVDNASTDGVVEEVRARWPEISVIESDVNRGFAGGTNLGLTGPTGLDDVDYVALVNNDVTVSPQWLGPLAATLSEDDGLGAVCPKILFESRFVDVELDATTARRARGDRRALGVRVSRAEVDGRDVTTGVQWWRGFWGPEPDSNARWSRDVAVLRVPVARGGPAPRSIRLRVEAAADGSVTLRAGGSPVRTTVDARPRWVTVIVGAEPRDVINNVGSELTSDGYGADRGYLEVDDGRFDEPTDVFAWCGAAVLLRAAYVDDVGMLDERLFLYYEDLELSWRGRDAGWRYRYVPGSVVHHVHSATVNEHSSLARYQNERNRLLVLARHAPPLTTARAAGRSLLITGSYARRDILSPVLHGQRPRAAIVSDRVRAFGGFLRRLPHATRTRREAQHRGRREVRD